MPLLMAGEPPALRAVCPAGAGPALLVDITGLKNRQGLVRVRVFGGAPGTWFDKKHWLQRIEVPTPVAGAVRFCMPVPRPGVYAVDVRHDVDGAGKTDRSDGGGVSGNPQIGLLDVLLGRKPDARKVRVQVGAGTMIVPITLKSLQGGSFAPWPGRR